MEERLLWIDALCIDKENLNETSQQVLLMKDVYFLTGRDVVCLSKDNTQTKQAMESSF